MTSTGNRSRVTRIVAQWFTIKGHKGQNSVESQCRGFSALESRCCGFLSSEKMFWNHEVVGYLSPFLDVAVF